MAAGTVFDSIGDTIDKINKMATDGVPVKLDHVLDQESVNYTGIVVVAAALLIVVMVGIKDFIVGRALK